MSSFVSSGELQYVSGHLPTGVGLWGPFRSSSTKRHDIQCPSRGWLMTDHLTINWFSIYSSIEYQPYSLVLHIIHTYEWWIIGGSLLVIQSSIINDYLSYLIIHLFSIYYSLIIHQSSRINGWLMDNHSWSNMIHAKVVIIHWSH